jgi:uncharacterized protein (TIGR00369 family)
MDYCQGPSMTVMSAPELNRFLDEAFGPEHPQVDKVEDGRVVVRVPASLVHLRPGGTVSGPTLMALADTAAYCQVLAHVGPVALAVTSSLNMTFLRKPRPVDQVAEASFLKLGKKLAVVDVRIWSEGQPDLVAQAVVTYALPSG